jgi:hypothetical protein
MSSHKQALLAPDADVTQHVGSGIGPKIAQVQCSGGEASFSEVAAALEAGVLPGLTNMPDDANDSVKNVLGIFAKMVAERPSDDPRSMNHPRAMRSVVILNAQGGMTNFRLDKPAADDDVGKGTVSTIGSDLP